MACINCGRTRGEPKNATNWQCSKCFSDDYYLTSVQYERQQRRAEGIAEGSFDEFGDPIEEPVILQYTDDMEPYIARKF